MSNPVFRIAHQGDAGGQTIMNISWWKTYLPEQNPVGQSTLIAFLAAVRGLYVTWFVPLFNSAYTYRRSVLVEVNGFEVLDPLPGSTKPRKRPTASRQFLDVVDSGTTGASATDLLPNTLAAIVHWNTGRYGRRRRGRWKLGPFDKADVNGDRLTTTAANAVSSAAAAYMIPQAISPGPQEFDPIVMSLTSLYEEDPPGDPYANGANIIDYTVQSILGTQRTRKFNDGTH